MQIELTRKQYRRLLDLVYIGNWVLNSTRGSDRFSDYDEVEGLLFTKAPSVGMTIDRCEKGEPWMGSPFVIRSVSLQASPEPRPQPSAPAGTAASNSPGALPRRPDTGWVRSAPVPRTSRRPWTAAAHDPPLD